MKLSKTAFMLLSILALLLLPFMTAEALPPLMQDDPPVDECLGPDDPFCPPPSGGGSGGGGGYGGYCYQCVTDLSEWPPIITCEPISGQGDGWSNCTVTYYSNGNISCGGSGYCSVITVSG